MIYPLLKTCLVCFDRYWVWIAERWSCLTEGIHHGYTKQSCCHGYNTSSGPVSNIIQKETHNWHMVTPLEITEMNAPLYILLCMDETCGAYFFFLSWTGNKNINCQCVNSSESPHIFTPDLCDNVVVPYDLVVWSSSGTWNVGLSPSWVKLWVRRPSA